MYQNRFVTIFLFFVVTCFLFSGCAWFQPEKEETAYGLAVEGMDAFKDGDYMDAVELFQKLKDR
ncbi:MAG: outer membrane protein assembly factor BamD, partial [Deltaproteobacteria bacterium]|nr:outer membrane protein assembly factor BamD [Deltaproteobacteria bacterium]